MSRSNKRPRVDYKPFDEDCDEAKGQPFTCICFQEPGESKGEFYTTDENGYFLHGSKYYRCEVDENKEIHFRFVRTLQDDEMNHLHTIGGDLNVIEDRSDKTGLWY